MPQNSEQLQKFQQVYNTLNEQQKEAVDTIEGPVMVIAGPGTGKTQILSARIGNILLNTDTLAENILCLTYTDAGVVAMRRRLKAFIGAEAYKVNIYTFHAFCNDIIQANLSYFEKNSLDAISDLESIDLFKELIDGFKKDNPLKRYRGDVYYDIPNLRSLFSTMKREGWTANFIEEKIDEFIEQVRNCEEDSQYYVEYKYKKKFKDKNVGDLKPKFEDLLDRMDKLRAAVEEFDRYQALMRRNNRYDFDDMINWVLKAFEENPLLLNNYQEQYLYILVDEYQDTSGTQNSLVHLLMNYWEKPNIFVVGDDDQSIYRFQGANLDNMVDFATGLSKDLKTIVLTKNYRSVQPVLDHSRTIIEKNKERLVNQLPGLSKVLVASNEKINALAIQPLLLEYATQRDEMIGITLSVEKLIQQGIQPGRIAVIYKEHKYGEELAKYFQLKNIFYYSKRNENVFTTPFGKKLLMVLNYLNAEQDAPFGGDEMLFEILHYDWFAIPPIEIAQLSIEVSKSQFKEDKTSIRKLLYEKVNAPARELFSAAIPAGFAKASNALESLIADVPNESLQRLFENVIVKLGLISFIMGSPEKFKLLKILTALFDFIKEETARNPYLNLQQLMSNIDLMKEEKLPIPIIEINGTDKGVNLLTAHGSKGLEFQYVYFAGCISGSWEKKRGNMGGFSYPDTLFFSVAKEKVIEELRRLFYVAMTRAEQHLFISYYKFDNKNKELEPTQFIAEIQEGQPFVAESCVISEEQKMAFQLLEFTRRQAPELQKQEADLLDEVLDKFVMNVTALNNFLKCPLSFYFNQLLRIPAAKNEALVFGTAVHFALEKLFTKMNSHNNIFPSKEIFIQDFDWSMKRNRENFVAESFNRRMEYGHEILGNYYNKYIDSWNKIVVVERMIKNVVVGGVPIKGKLDKLEFDGKQVNVVDYKTGKFDNAKDKLKAPDDKNPLGGDYWRQAVFYKILLDHYDLKDWRVTSVEFDFVEPDNKKEYHRAKLSIAPGEVEVVKQQMQEVWHKIQERDFYTGCGKEDCHYCNFVKDNDLYVELHDLDEEEV
ncbi:ATP-dependent helicase [Arachidicoccus sp.]|uniref:ATP-dependent helicase n=1 Tax=Arachidicoccus sp. TaxID=1872624 RepID=UPI003D1D9FB5